MPFKALDEDELERRWEERLAKIEQQLERDDMYQKVQGAKIGLYEAEIRSMREHPELFAPELEGMERQKKATAT